MRRAAPWVLLASLLASCAGERAEPAKGTGPAGPAPPEVARPYDEGADAQAQIDAALASAQADHRRVLLVFGANWCPWCRRLEYVLRNDPGVTSALARGYHLVHVDVGPRESSTNRDVARRYGDPLANGLPCLVVLDPDGSVVHVQETGALEDGDHHDPARVVAFLDRYAAAG